MIKGEKMKTKTVESFDAMSTEYNNKHNVQRFAAVIGLKDEFEQRYRELHANVWPTVLEQIKRSNIRNYSIFTTELFGKKYLFSYFEYIGEDINKDLAAMAQDKDTQRWWQETDICQIRLPNTMPDEQWKPMEQVFFQP